MPAQDLSRRLLTHAGLKGDIAIGDTFLSALKDEIDGFLRKRPSSPRFGCEMLRVIPKFAEEHTDCVPG